MLHSIILAHFSHSLDQLFVLLPPFALSFAVYSIVSLIFLLFDLLLALDLNSFLCWRIALTSSFMHSYPLLNKFSSTFPTLCQIKVLLISGSASKVHTRTTSTSLTCDSQGFKRFARTTRFLVDDKTVGFEGSSTALLCV